MTAGISDYINEFPQEVRKILSSMYAVIKKAAPEAEETISYGMPAFKVKGKALIYFAGYKNHIGLYATPTGHTKFAKALSKFKQGKGSVQFPLGEPVPYDLIEKIVAFRRKEVLEKKAVKKTGRA